MSRLVLANVNLLDGEAPAVSKRTIVIDGDRVVSVGSYPHIIEEDDRVVDLNGRTVMPGMATCHYHSTYPSGMHKGFAPYGYEYPPGYQHRPSQSVDRAPTGLHPRRRCWGRMRH
jgi:cytosine/adenosine deaminase-related metal-dependent hydrolase